MTGTGTIINSAAIVLGGLAGHFTGKLFRQEQQEALTVTCGISVMFIAIAGAMQGMLKIDKDMITSGRSMLVVLCLAIGTVIGELIGIERGFEVFGEWLKVKTGNSKEGLWMRNNGSTLTSQAIDTVVFTFIAFWGVYPKPVFFSILFTTYLFKALVALVDTPFMYAARMITPADER